MSVLFGKALSKEDEEILAWAKKKKSEEKTNPQDGIPTVEASAVNDGIVKRIEQLEAKSTKNNKTGFSTSKSLQEFKEKTDEQNKLRLNEIKGLRKSIETLEVKVGEHDLSIKTHRKELNLLNKLKL